MRKGWIQNRKGKMNNCGNSVKNGRYACVKRKDMRILTFLCILADNIFDPSILGF